MRRCIPLAAVAVLFAACARPGRSQDGGTTPGKAPRRRGHAVAAHGRPKLFPHRIWAFSGFEARPPSFGWFGDEEKKNLPAYPGNQTARRATGPYRKYSARMVGMNPVPGPRMGKVNKLYVRYFLRGTDAARFQHYSLSASDNCNIRVSGLKQGEWAETVMNFTLHSRRNDGSPGAFKEGERMDDLKVFVGKPNDGKTYELIIDDPIFFAEDPDLPPEPEPFPKRVIFLAAFDTGIDPRSRPKFYPGEFQPAVRGTKERFGIAAHAPKGSYWVVAKAVPMKGNEKDAHVLLQMNPPRPVGPNTKVRFRYWLKGADRIAVTLADAAAGRERDMAVTDCTQAEWVTQYVTVSKNEALAGGGKLPTGSPLRSIRFVVPNKAGVELYVDEVIVFDAATP